MLHCAPEFQTIRLRQWSKMISQTTSPRVNQHRGSLPPVPQQRVRANGFRVMLLCDPPGLVELPGLRNTIVAIHVGASVQASCTRGGCTHRGKIVHGDIEIMPARTPSVWEMREKDTFLVLSVSPELLNMAGEELELDPRRVEIRNRFQVRDTQLESIGWALKAEMECGYPTGRLYLDSLAVSVAARLVRAAKRWSPRAKPLSAPTESSRSSGLRHVLQTKYEIAGKGAAVYQLMGLSAGWARPSVSGPPEFVRAAPHTGATT